jgi:hypothetical protein
MPMHGDDAVSQGGGIGDGDRREVQCVLASDRPAAQPHRGRWWSKLFAADTDRLGWYVATRDMHGGTLDLSKRVRVGRSSDATLLCLIITSLQYVTATLDPLTWLAC